MSNRMMNCFPPSSTKSGNTYYFCFDYGYLLLPEENVLIVNWQPDMEKTKV